MFTKDIGIDLGTANTLVYMKGRGIIMREPSVVAVDPRSDELRVRSVGHEAKAVIGRAPGSIVAVRPLKDGVIADFDITAAMLQSFIRQACGSTLLARPRVVICVPSGVTEVERRAVRQAAAKAGARQVTVIEEPMAAAIGSGGKTCRIFTGSYTGTGTTSVSIPTPFYPVLAFVQSAGMATALCLFRSADTVQNNKDFGVGDGKSLTVTWGARQLSWVCSSGGTMSSTYAGNSKNVEYHYVIVGFDNAGA